LKLKTIAVEKRLPISYSRKGHRGQLIIFEPNEDALSLDGDALLSKHDVPALDGLGEGAEVSDLICSSDDDILSPCTSLKTLVVRRLALALDPPSSLMQDQLLALALDPPLEARPPPPVTR